MLRHSVLTSVLMGILAGTAGANDFSDPIFAAPIRSRPGTFLPPGSTLNAPVITPMASRHGHQMFEVTPVGRDRDTVLTHDPESYLSGHHSGHCGKTNENVGWLTLEYLYWATQGPAAPPLVTTGPAILGPGIAGVAGNPTTVDLLGGERMLNGLRSGYRLSGGVFLDRANTRAISFSTISLGSRSERLVGGSDGTNLVNLPQFNTLFGIPVQTPLYVGFPGITRGTVTALAQTSFYTGDVHLNRVYQSGNGFRFDVLTGYRFLQLGDAVATSFDVVPALVPGPRFMGEESTRTRNYFNGGDVGFNFQGRVGRLAFEMQSTVAFGATTTRIDRSFTRSLIAGAGLGALLGVPLPPIGIPMIQSGSQSTECDFAVVPQFGMKLGWQPVDHLRLTAGYDFVYWSRVRRAPELYTGNNFTTDFWAQGVSLGAELRY